MPVARVYDQTNSRWVDITGPRGPSGAPIGSVATVGALPLDASVDDVYTVDADGHAYRWDGSAWVDIGAWRGPGGGGADTGMALDIRDFGGTDDNSTNNAAAFAAAIVEGKAAGVRTITLPHTDTGTYRVYDTIAVDAAGFTFEGSGWWRPGTTGGTAIDFRGSGDLFQLDEEQLDGEGDPIPYDASDYSGTGYMFTLRNLHLVCGAPDTPLDGNPVNSYKAGSYAIRDWRSGEVFLDHVSIEAFDYPYWGVAGDINEASVVRLFYNHSGIYLGPRSDQNTWHFVYSYKNDRVMDADGAQSVVIRDLKSVDDGSATSAPYRIRGGADGVTFYTPWFEHYDGAAEIPGFVDVGVGDADESKNVTLIAPKYITNASGAGARAKHAIRVGKARNIRVLYPHGSGMPSLDAFWNVTGADNVQAVVDADAPNDVYATSVVKSSTGSLQVTGLLNTSGTPTLPSSTGRINVTNTTTPASNWYISAFQPGWFGVNHGTAKTVDLQRPILDGTAAPTSGTYTRGTFMRNTAPSVLGTAGNQYIVWGWSCTLGGTPGTWVEVRTLTGT
jgi:hypothetical protein